MSGGNGKGNNILRPGQNMPQGHVLGPGGMDVKEMELREALHLDYAMASNLQQGIMMAGDIVKKYDPDGPFSDVPERERQRTEGAQLTSDLTEMQLRLLRSIRKKTKKCKPFSGMKDLKFIDMEDATEV